MEQRTNPIEKDPTEARVRRFVAREAAPHGFHEGRLGGAEVELQETERERLADAELPRDGLGRREERRDVFARGFGKDLVRRVCEGYGASELLGHAGARLRVGE